jgi:Flp pilus assembly pilin Flp
MQEQAMSFKSFNKFLSDESGAVTVDWVVLTAALVGLGLAVMSVVSTGLEDLSGDIQGQLEADHITDAFGTTATP